MYSVYISHSAHLCMSNACEKLPCTAGDLLHDVYNYFCYSTKRQAELQELQYFTETEPHKLVKLIGYPFIPVLLGLLNSGMQYFQVAVQKGQFVGH